MKIYKFTNKKRFNKDFVYVTSPIAQINTEFDEEENCLLNRANPDIKVGAKFDYISVVNKNKVSSNTAISAVCSFEDYGAPALVFSDDIVDVNGVKTYGVHYEIVGYYEGINVWYLYPTGDRENPLKYEMIASWKVPIGCNEKFTISAKIVGKDIYVYYNNKEYKVSHQSVPNEFYVGFTACEGIDRFFSFKIDCKGQNYEK